MNQQKVGLFLKELRSEKSITQAELAELIGVSNRSISRWENGTTMYRKYGIQYAMLGHMGCHIVSKLIWMILV